MIVLTKNNIATRDAPTMSRDELEVEWRKANEYFFEVRAQKVETDRLYVAAANQLNTLERQLKKIERQAAFSKR
jgi:hypothetical protein